MDGSLDTTFIQSNWELITAMLVTFVGGLGALVINKPNLFKRAERSDNPQNPTSDRIADLAARVGVLEVQVTQGVTREEFHQVSIDMTRMMSELQAVQATTTATRLATERTQTILFDIARGQ